jgi:hypothetical protein
VPRGGRLFRLPFRFSLDRPGESIGLLALVSAAKLGPVQDSSSSSLHNPYAPPLPEVATGWRPTHTAEHHAVDIQEALRRLNQHIADPGASETDRRELGARFRTVGWVLLGIGVVAAALAAVGGVEEWGEGAVLLVVGVVGGILAFIGALALAMDLSLVPRDRPSPPDKTLKSLLKAMTMARYGYVWATLCPTAREQVVSGAQLGAVKTLPGEFPLRNPTEVKTYLSSFARAAGSVMRVMSVKKMVLGPVDGDVTRIEVELRFQSWPRWVSIAAGIGFIVFRPLAIVGAIAFFVMRKRYATHVTKTLLRASNGVWYVYDGDVLEGARSV